MAERSFLRDLRVEDRFDAEAWAKIYDRGLSQEGEKIVESFAELVKKFPPAQTEEEGRVPDEAMKMMAAAGAFGMTIPTEYGGLGMSFPEYLEVVRLLSQMDMSLGLVSLAHLSIGLQGIVLYGNEEQKQKYLPPAARGELVFAYALTEPDTGSDAQHITTTARPVEDDDGVHYELTGQKAYITNANYAHAFTVFAQLDGREPGQMGAFIVEAGWEGVKVGPDMPKMGLKSSSTASITFDKVKVPAANMLGEAGEGFKYALGVLSFGRLAVAAAGVGLMKRSLDDMVARATKRTQFGAPIASFELIQEKIANAASNHLAGDAMVRHASTLLECDPYANVAMETSHCKLFCTIKTWETLYDALQVAGGSGYLSTNPYERRMRDWRVTTIFEGTTEIHSIYPSLLLARDLGRELPEGKWEKVKKLLRGALLDQPDLPHGGMAPGASALKTARRCHRALKFGARAALMVHGKKIAEREFVLCRLTWLGVMEYGLLSIASLAAKCAERNGDSCMDPDAFELFRAKANSHIRAVLNPWPSAREKRVRALAARITGKAKRQ